METLRIPQPDAEGNYDSPPLAAVRRCWQDFLDGAATEDDLILTLQAFEDRVQFELDDLDAQVEQKKADPQDPSFIEIVAGFGQQLKAVERMLLELEEPDIGHMEAGLALAQKANNRLMQAFQQRMAQEPPAPTSVTCMFCGTECPLGSSRCTNCSRPLPVTGEPAQQSSSFSVMQQDGLEANHSSRRLTQNAAHLIRSVEAWRAGQLDWESLYCVLDELEEKLLAHQEANQQNIAEQGDAEGLLGRTDKLLEESLAALDHMRLAWDKEDQSYLDSGITQFVGVGEQLLGTLDEMKGR